MGRHQAYADRRPYVLPVSLDDLVGPTSGLVQVPTSLGWTGRRCYDIDDSADARVLYERVIVEASEVDDVVHTLDAAQLLAAWPHLYLPAPVRRMWEARFPELVRSQRSAGMSSR